MSLKTLLVHVGNDPHHRVRLRMAFALARAQGAQVTALFVAKPVGARAAVAGRAASAAFLAELQETAAAEMTTLRAEAERLAAANGVALAWHEVEGTEIEALAHHAHVADLCIVSQPGPEVYLEDHFRPRLVDELLRSGGVPLLLLPLDHKDEPFGRHALVAWHPNREAVRAIRDALPLLIAAQQVTVVSVGESVETLASEMEVAAYLRHHGARAEALSVAEEEGIGQTLLATAQRLDCDLLVMGAYGRSRLAEVVLGGTTHHVIHHLHLPVLMSH